MMSWEINTESGWDVMTECPACVAGLSRSYFIPYWDECDDRNLPAPRIMKVSQETYEKLLALTAQK